MAGRNVSDEIDVRPGETRVSARVVVAPGPMGPSLRFIGSLADAMIDLAVSLLAALRTVERLRHGQDIEGDGVCPNDAAVLSFQRACGCIDGDTLSVALHRIKHILREGGGIIPSPCEGIPDAAERVVRRAERAEKLAAAERAYRVAIEAREKAFLLAADETPEARAAYGRALVAASAAARTLIEASGTP
jgi:hypothetical protein